MVTCCFLGYDCQAVDAGSEMTYTFWITRWQAQICT